MTGSSSDAPAVKRWHFDVLVSDGFVLVELAGLIDVLRLANRVGPFPVFEWTYRSAKGGPVASRAGAYVDTEPFAQRPTSDYAVVIGNTDPDSPDLSMGSVIRAYTYRGAQVILLSEAASRYIDEQSGEKVRRLATHWENAALMRERGVFEADNAIASQDGQVVTCAGMGTTVDIALELVGRHMSSAAKMAVADIHLHDKIRDFSTQQPFGGSSVTSTGDEEVDECIKLMQANIETPLRIQDLAREFGLSTRSMERKFSNLLNATPLSYYRQLRLHRANNLLMNTTMTVQEIGLVCGFAHGFSKHYRNFFGVAPHEARKASKQRRTG